MAGAAAGLRARRAPAPAVAPGHGPDLHGPRPFTAELLPHVEGLLAIFRAAGLPDHIAAEAGDLISTYIDGFVLEEGMWQDRAAREDGEDASLARPDWQEMADRMRDYFASLPAEDFPHLRALSGLMVSGSSDERFDTGLEIILRGLASYLPDAPPADDAADRAPACSPAGLPLPAPQLR